MGRKNDLRRLKAKTAVCRQNDALSRHRRHSGGGEARFDQDRVDCVLAAPVPGKRQRTMERIWEARFGTLAHG